MLIVDLKTPFGEPCLKLTGEWNCFCQTRGRSKLSFLVLITPQQITLYTRNHSLIRGRRFLSMELMQFLTDNSETTSLPKLRREQLKLVT